MKPCVLATLFALALLAFACSTIPAEQCAKTDWRAQGTDDGRDGRPADHLQRHREACAGVGVVPDAAAWERGRQTGLKEYCKLPNAIQAGLERRSYRGVCDDPRFARLHDAASRLGDARNDIETIDRDLEWRERQLATSKSINEKRRTELRAEIRGLERQRDRARDDRHDAEIALERIRRELGL